ncbi:hypothetical protein C8Q74DRAFT_151904 [Fomes fomentarius]|nr:hypothetical protein C8Q74DRAFT_151904 [Fomes fomentarius]
MVDSDTRCNFDLIAGAAPPVFTENSITKFVRAVDSDTAHEPSALMMPATTLLQTALWSTALYLTHATAAIRPRASHAQPRSPATRLVESSRADPNHSALTSAIQPTDLKMIEISLIRAARVSRRQIRDALFQSRFPIPDARLSPRSTRVGEAEVPFISTDVAHHAHHTHHVLRPWQQHDRRASRCLASPRVRPYRPSSIKTLRFDARSFEISRLV